MKLTQFGIRCHAVGTHRNQRNPVNRLEMGSVQEFGRAVLLLAAALQFAAGEPKLEMVQVVFRHGDRTPSRAELFPNAPRNPIYDDLGYGQLTEAGKNRALRLGTFLNSRYNGTLLGETPGHGEVYAVSTDYDRTKMSLQMVLRGLYPDAENTPAVPLHYVPRIIDGVLQGFRCSKYVDEAKKVKRSSAYQTLMAQNKELFKYINQETGVNTTEDPLIRVGEVYQVLASEKSLNLSIPAWVTREIEQKIETIVAIEYELESYTPTMKRIFGGQLLKEFIDNMDGNNAKVPGNRTKIFLYSGHELNVAAFAKVNGFTEPAIPLYSSAIIVEKWVDGQEESLEIYLWTGVTEELIQFKIPYCGFTCPYEAYKLLMQDHLPTKLESDCLWNDVTKRTLQNYYLTTKEEK